MYATYSIDFNYQFQGGAFDILLGTTSETLSAVSSSFSMLIGSSGSALMRALYFLAIISQSTTFSILVALLKLNWEPKGLRWTTDRRVESGIGNENSLNCFNIHSDSQIYLNLKIGEYYLWAQPVHV